MDIRNTVRAKRRRLTALWGVWQARSLLDAEHSIPSNYKATIDLHCLRRSAENFLHQIYLVTAIEEDIEIDTWHANLDVDEEDLWITTPFWNLDTFFANGSMLPSGVIERHDSDTKLIVTAWHGQSKTQARRFELWR